MGIKKINNIIWSLSARREKKRLAKQTFMHEDIVVKKDVKYSDRGQRSLLDIYFPKNHSGKLPIIINVPGGGYTVGEKENNRLQSEMFAKQGFCVLTINYRRINEESFPAPIEDLFDVFAFIQKKSFNNVFDTDNVFLMGDSAGAHIAALASVMANNHLMQYDFGVFSNIKIKACAFFSSSFKIINIPFIKNKYKKAIYGDKLIFDKVTKIKELVDAKFPPNITISPINDFLIFQSFEFNKKCKAMGVENEFVVLKSGKKLGHNSMIKYATDPTYNQMYEQVFKFFKDRVKTQKTTQENIQVQGTSFQSKQTQQTQAKKTNNPNFNLNKKKFENQVGKTSNSKNNQEREM